MSQANNQKYFLYIRGMPGVGKITVARILEKKLKKLDFHLFWLHDVKNPIQKLLREYRLSHVMDHIQLPILKYLVDHGKNVIFVRPSPNLRTVNSIRRILKKYPEYKLYIFTLIADLETLAVRVSKRKDPYRSTNKKQLIDYLTKRPKFKKLKNGTIIDTSSLTPNQVADIIIDKINIEQIYI